MTDLTAYYCLACGDAFCLEGSPENCPDCRRPAPTFRPAAEHIKDLWEKQCTGGICKMDAAEFTQILSSAFDEKRS